MNPDKTKPEEKDTKPTPETKNVVVIIFFSLNIN